MFLIPLLVTSRAWVQQNSIVSNRDLDNKFHQNCAKLKVTFGTYDIL